MKTTIRLVQLANTKTPIDAASGLNLATSTFRALAGLAYSPYTVAGVSAAARKQQHAFKGRPNDG
jgi:hypothetical protein